MRGNEIESQPDRKVFGLSQSRHDGRGKNPVFFSRGGPLSGKKAGFLCCSAHSQETFRSAESVFYLIF
ncbi:Uncharacterized protein dnm_028720 [Desulfonema magnum]|uniref:Uncharacterized protein n=1 Tax=Desulfonema magnum TaxID=45655 RepID=A0A975GNG3_9BACT|nr:Uncharacterized protein dnm_028720 [Desulfonema magnum]